jgi:hypothetical protein
VSLVARLTPIIDVGGLRLGVADELSQQGSSRPRASRKIFPRRRSEPLKFRPRAASGWPERSGRRRVCLRSDYRAGLVEATVKMPVDSLTALVVEDDWFVREDIANAFRKEGWTVLEAATGEGVLQHLREAHSIDLVVTDIGLADEAMTGWDVAEAVSVAGHFGVRFWIACFQWLRVMLKHRLGHLT